MVTVSAHFDGKVIVPDEPTDLIPGTRLRVTIEAVDAAPTPRGELDLPVLSGVRPDLVHAILLDPGLDLIDAEVEGLGGSVTPGSQT